MRPTLANPQFYNTGAALHTWQSGAAVHGNRKTACLENTIYICTLTYHSFMHYIMYSLVQSFSLWCCKPGRGL